MIKEIASQSLARYDKGEGETHTHMKYSQSYIEPELKAHQKNTYIKTYYYIWVQRIAIIIYYNQKSRAITREEYREKNENNVIKRRFPFPMTFIEQYYHFQGYAESTHTHTHRYSQILSLFLISVLTHTHSESDSPLFWLGIQYLSSDALFHTKAQHI